jgi:hypothetical protein
MKTPETEVLTIEELMAIINLWKNLENVPHSVTDKTLDTNSRYTKTK